MAYTERPQILLESEINDLYSPPGFTLEERRFYFALNDLEVRAVKSIRSRSHRCFFVASLGYFKSRPVVLSPSFGEVEEDLRFIAKEQLPGRLIRRFTLNQRQRGRLYKKIFDLQNYQKWQGNSHRDGLISHLQLVAKSWVEPRYLFDTATEYLSLSRIAIPSYTVLQAVVSLAMNREHKRIAASLQSYLSNELPKKLGDLVDGTGT